MVPLGLAVVGPGRTLAFGRWPSNDNLVRDHPWLT